LREFSNKKGINHEESYVVSVIKIARVMAGNRD